MNGGKRLRIAALVTAAVAVAQHGCKALETIHTIDFATHLNESPTLTKVVTLLGGRYGIITVITLLAALVWMALRTRLKYDARRNDKCAARLNSTATARVVPSAGHGKHRARRIIEEHEEEVEVRRIKTRRVVEEDDG